MRSNVTSGLTLSFYVSIVMLILLSVGNRTHAKRGCSAFGHSCFGGHGKRFDPQSRQDMSTNSNPVAIRKIQDYENPRFNKELLLDDPDQRLQEQQQSSSFVGNYQEDPVRLDPSNLSFLVDQWLASHRRANQLDVKVNDD